MPADATERMLEDNLEPISTLAKGRYRSGFLVALERALSVRTADRPQSIAEWREDLFQVGPKLVATQDQRSSPSSSARAAHVAGQVSATATSPRPLSQAGQPGELSRERPKSSILSERPDLSWLDEVEQPAEPAKPQSMMDNPSVLKGTYGALGIIGGAVVGALASIVLAGVFSTGCSSDSCIFMFAPACGAIGALIGGAIGVQLARARMRGEGPADFGPLDGSS